MPAVDDGLSDKGLTIAAAARECLRSFQRCLETASPVNSKQMSMIEEQTAIFRGWTTGAAVFDSSSASMDHRLLQFAPEVHSAVTGLLVSLNYQCQKYLDSATLIRVTLDKGQDDAPSDVFLKSLTGVTAEINRLINISNTIYRASMDTVSFTPRKFYIKDRGGFNVEGTLLYDFHCHINVRFPKLGVSMQDRLARAMLARRRRILYRKSRHDHVYGKSQDYLPAAPNLVQKAIVPSEEPRTMESKVNSPNTKAAVTNLSQIELLTLSVVPAKTRFATWSCENLIFPPAPGHTIASRYDQLTGHQRAAKKEGSSIQKGELDIEALQEVLSKDMHGLGDISCPYCLCLPPVEDIFDEAKWRDHVMDDLDAYVCVFEDCDQPSVLYTDTDQWLNHSKKHRRVWRCPSHRDHEPFSSDEEYITHMREVHATKLSDKQLRMLANKVSRNAKLFPMCPLCGKENFKPTESVEKHVAGHMRLLALESLPGYREDIPAFDLYRLVGLSENSEGCEGKKRFHIDTLLECAYPSMDIQQLRFEDYTQREQRMFFSRSRLNNLFAPFVNILLDCQCLECKLARDKDMDMTWVSEMKSQLQHHPWILGFMIYLGRLHYIYYWMKWGFVDTLGDVKFDIMEGERLAKKLITPALERSGFEQTYRRATSMFYPVVFEIQDNETCPYRDLSDSLRLPYLKAETISSDGFYGTMTKVEILPEHLDSRIINLATERYSSPETNADSDRKLLFALKSVKTNPKSPLNSMEHNILEMISRTQGPASDNIITILFAYNWKGQMHFLLPFIEMNLDHVLRNKACPRYHSSKLESNEYLPSHWLWREVKGVCAALDVFHRKMSNPFVDFQGTIIDLQLNLSPANILVTADGKLKVTDFEHSINRISEPGGNMTLPHSPGESRYAAPESRPILDYSSKNPEEINVLLNYDVWSLGCIMVEVLIHLLDLQTVEAFDRQLGEESNAGFFNGADLKQCVNSSLDSFRHMFLNTAQGPYMAAVTQLIRRMLHHDVKNRPYSWQVVEELERAETTLMKLPTDPNRTSPAVKGYQLLDSSGFRELGWDNGNSIVSFADMAGITLELVHQRDGRSDQSKPCRIRVFRKSSRTTQGPVEIGLVAARAQGGTVEMTQRKFEVTKSFFSPTYLFRDQANWNGRFECKLFPDHESELAFIFQFESIQDVLTFQGALMQRKILPPIRAKIAAMTPRSNRLLKTYQPPEFNSEMSYIQLWAHCEQKYLKAASSTADDTRSGPQSISASGSLVVPLRNERRRTSVKAISKQQAEDKSSLQEQCSTMVIFFEFLSPWIIPLNDGRKRFENTGKSSVRVVCRKNHRSFKVRQLPAKPAWRGQDLKEIAHASSSVLLEADYEDIAKREIDEPFKVENMTVVLENSADRDRLREATSTEWQ